MDLNMEGIAWRDKGIIRYLSALDTIIAIFLFGFYLIGGVILNTIIVDISGGLLSKFTLILASTAVWIVVFAITFLQMRSAYNVFISTYQDALGPQVIIKKLQIWMKTSIIVLGLVAVKIIYFFIRKNRVFSILWFLCGLQIFIRVFALYFVRESIDDLKQEVFVIRKAKSSTKSKSITSIANLKANDKVTEDV